MGELAIIVSQWLSRFGGRVYADGPLRLHNGPDPDIVKPGLAEKLRYAAADPRIGAVAAEGCGRRP